jgi:cobalt-zinc-cadmium efflux system outer membrane protein
MASQEDLERTLLFSLRVAFVQVLQEKALVELGRDNLAYYDRVLEVNRARFEAGAIARVDLDRLELQRVQYESDLQTAEVTLRTAKIQLLLLINEPGPLEAFDVAGSYDLSRDLPPLEDLRRMALDARPDLKAALESSEKAKVDHRLAEANGTADPTLAVDAGRNPPIDAYLGVNVAIPLRIFDRNQGEKARTEVEIARSASLLEASRVQVLSDVDSAYAEVTSGVLLLKPYKATYLEQATRVRDTVSFSYEHGAASLLDFLAAQADYRTVEVNYLNLVASYLNSVNQLNLAVGREVMP